MPNQTYQYVIVIENMCTDWSGREPDPDESKIRIHHCMYHDPGCCCKTCKNCTCDRCLEEKRRKRNFGEVKGIDLFPKDPDGTKFAAQVRGLPRAGGSNVSKRSLNDIYREPKKRSRRDKRK